MYPQSFADVRVYYSCYTTFLVEAEVEKRLEQEKIESESLQVILQKSLNRHGMEFYDTPEALSM